MMQANLVLKKIQSTSRWERKDYCHNTAWRRSLRLNRAYFRTKPRNQILQRSQVALRVFHIKVTSSNPVWVTHQVIITNSWLVSELVISRTGIHTTKTSATNGTFTEYFTKETKDWDGCRDRTILFTIGGDPSKNRFIRFMVSFSKLLFTFITNNHDRKHLCQIPSDLC